MKWILKKINHIQSTLVISKSKGPSKTVRDIRTSTYQICSIEEKTIWTTNFYKWLCNLTPLNRNIYWKYCGKGEQFLLFSTIFYNLILDFCVITRTRFFLRDKRLFEITEVEITRVDCILVSYYIQVISVCNCKVILVYHHYFSFSNCLWLPTLLKIYHFLRIW